MSTAVVRNMSIRTFAALSVGTLVFALIGCAGTSDTPESQTAESETQAAPVDENATEAPAGPTTSELGTITVGTTTYDVVETVNCVPVSASDVLTRVFEVIAVAQSDDGEEAMLFAYTDEQSGLPSHSVDYQGPEGTWGTPEGNATFVRDAGSLSGAGTLIDDADTQSIMVQFDFAVPDELVEC